MIVYFLLFNFVLFHFILILLLIHAQLKLIYRYVFDKTLVYIRELNWFHFFIFFYHFSLFLELLQFYSHYIKNYFLSFFIDLFKLILMLLPNLSNLSEAFSFSCFPFIQVFFDFSKLSFDFLFNIRIAMLDHNLFHKFVFFNLSLFLHNFIIIFHYLCRIFPICKSLFEKIVSFCQLEFIIFL